MYCKQAVIAVKVLLHSKHCNKHVNASIIAWQVLLRCNKASSDSNASIITCIATLARKSRNMRDLFTSLPCLCLSSIREGVP